MAAGEVQNEKPFQVTGGVVLFTVVFTAGGLGVARVLRAVLSEAQATMDPGLPALAVEASLYTVILLLFSSCTALRRLFAELGTAHRSLLLLILWCVVVGQLSKSTRATFPLVAWNMYTRAAPSGQVLFLEFEGITGSGQHVRLDPGDVFPSLSRYRLATWFRRQAVQLALADDASRVPLERQFVRTATSLGDRWNRSHSDDRLTELQVKLGRFDWQSYTSDDQVTRRTIGQVTWKDGR